MNGDGEIRTLDPLLARQVLSQLSYTPIDSGSHLLSHAVTSIVPSADQVLTVVFGMGTGVSPDRIATGNIWFSIRNEVRARFACSNQARTKLKLRSRSFSLSAYIGNSTVYRTLTSSSLERR